MKKKPIKIASIQSLLKDPYPLIPEGRYEVDILTWATGIIYGKALKLDVTFVITDGNYAGVKIHYYCNVKRIIGKPKEKGKFIAGKKSKLARQFYRAMEIGKKPTGSLRLDRLPLTELRNLTVLIRSVKAESDKTPIPLGLHYSVIDKLLGIKSE